MTEPSQFYAGDLVEWTAAPAGYPSSAWTLLYVFSGVKFKRTVAAEADGAGFKVSIPPDDSKDFVPGAYSLTALVVDSPDTVTKRFTLYQLPVTVHPDLPALTAPLDQRSHAQKMLAAIEEVLEGRAVDDVQSYTIMGRSLNKIPFNELYQARNEYRRQVRDEMKAASGKATYGQKIRVGFSNG